MCYSSLTSCCGCTNVRTGSKIIGIITLIYYVNLAIIIICKMTGVQELEPLSISGIGSDILLLLVSIAMIVVNTFLLLGLDDPTLVKMWLIVDMICVVV